MCGVVGAFDPHGEIGRARVETLNRAQGHRGPDHSVVAELGPFLLGNTRLAIQNPTAEANQPFFDSSGRFATVFNGEIYNFKELAREHHLELKTGCDGEIIPQLWERHGPKCLNLFRGMYAILVADLREERLYLARDPFGIKPLYWRRFGSGMLVASEPKPLWSVDRSLPVDPESIDSFLRWGSVAADRSPFLGMACVGPGECLSFDGSMELRGEQSIPAISAESEVALRDRTSLAEAFRSSVRAHLVSDVPTALLLSAGVDSTLIALAAKELGVSLHCLTVTSDLGVDESMQARATAAEYGHSHDTVPTELADGDVEHFFRSMQRPTIDGLNSFLVNRAVATAGYKVALSGLGGDEALGGYDYAWLLRALPLMRMADAVPGLVGFASRLIPGRRFSGSGKLERLASADGPRQPAGLVELQRELFPSDVVRSLVGRASPVEPEAGIASGYVAMAEAELRRYLQPMLLPDADAFSMAWSVELRVPFVDVAFFDAALRRDRLRGKQLLVDQMDNRYLRVLSRRRKTGFSVPMGDWIRSGRLRSLVERAEATDAPVWNYLDRNIGLPILASSTATDRWSAPWAIVALDCWLRTL